MVCWEVRWFQAQQLFYVSFIKTRRAQCHIEIYENTSRGSGSGWSPLKSRIDRILQELGLGHDAITTIIDCTPESCDGRKKPMPFIRVCCTDADEMEEIIKAFKERKLGVDTEKLLLGGFIPADEMKGDASHDTNTQCIVNGDVW